MSPLLTGETIRNGQVVPENEVDRGGPEVMSFLVREARTVHEGPRRRGKRTASSTGETPVPQDVMQSFLVREAATVVLPPPHWAHLKGPQVPQAGTPAPQTPAPLEE